MQINAGQTGHVRRGEVNIMPLEESWGRKTVMFGDKNREGVGVGVWTRNTGDMSHGVQSPRGHVGAVYKRK